MKKTLVLAVLFITASTSIKAQTFNDVNVEKRLFGIQIGILEAKLYNESKIANYTTLRSEMTLYGGFWAGAKYSKTGFLLIPALNVEPRYYYNLQKRAKKGRNIKNNGANYFSLLVSYTPNWFVISNYDVIKLNNEIRFIPTFGIRRNFAKNFNYEFNVGYGYGFIFREGYNDSGFAFDIGFKIGYDF